LRTFNENCLEALFYLKAFNDFDSVLTQIAEGLESLFCLKAFNDFVQNVKVPKIPDFGDLYILHKIVESLEAKKCLKVRSDLEILLLFY